MAAEVDRLDRLRIPSQNEVQLVLHKKMRTARNFSVVNYVRENTARQRLSHLSVAVVDHHLHIS